MNGSDADDLLIEQYHDYVYSSSEKYYASITFVAIVQKYILSSGFPKKTILSWNTIQKKHNF